MVLVKSHANWSETYSSVIRFRRNPCSLYVLHLWKNQKVLALWTSWCEAHIVFSEAGQSWGVKKTNVKAVVIIWQLESQLYQWKPQVAQLADNGVAFCERMFKKFAEDWSIWLWFRCAYVPVGNVIKERYHHTIKQLGVRKQGSLQEVVD